MRILNRLRRGQAPASPAPATLPEGLRVYAIGDVHGRLDLLDALLARIAADDAARAPCRTQLVLLGDLVDRGPESKGVIERARELAAGGARLIMGNHEEMFLRTVDGDVEALRLMLRVGGKETILSYGVGEDAFAANDFDALLARFIARVPPRHIAFLRGFENWVRYGDYLFTHAGIRPAVPLEEQSPADLRWIRREFLDCEDDHGYVVVHGHTISEAVEERSNRIGIDTGAFASGRLTALALEGAARWYLNT